MPVAPDLGELGERQRIRLRLKLSARGGWFAREQSRLEAAHVIGVGAKRGDLASRGADRARVGVSDLGGNPGGLAVLRAGACGEPMSSARTLRSARGACQFERGGTPTRARRHLGHAPALALAGAGLGRARTRASADAQRCERQGRRSEGLRDCRVRGSQEFPRADGAGDTRTVRGSHRLPRVRERMEWALLSHSRSRAFLRVWTLGCRGGRLTGVAGGGSRLAAGRRTETVGVVATLRSGRSRACAIELARADGHTTSDDEGTIRPNEGVGDGRGSQPEIEGEEATMRKSPRLISRTRGLPTSLHWSSSQRPPADVSPAPPRGRP